MDLKKIVRLVPKPVEGEESPKMDQVVFKLTFVNAAIVVVRLKEYTVHMAAPPSTEFTFEYSLEVIENNQEISEADIKESMNAILMQVVRQAVEKRTKEAYEASPEGQAEAEAKTKFPVTEKARGFLEKLDALERQGLC